MNLEYDDDGDDGDGDGDDVGNDGDGDNVHNWVKFLKLLSCFRFLCYTLPMLQVQVHPIIWRKFPQKISSVFHVLELFWMYLNLY